MDQVFKLHHNLFEVKFPKNWEINAEQSVYTFCNPEEMDGIIQISVFVNKNKSVHFNIDKEFESERRKHPTAAITNLSNYKASHYGLNLPQNNMLSYEWITGNGNVKLFCTVILNSQQSNDKLDQSYLKTLDILNTIKIISVW